MKLKQIIFGFMSELILIFSVIIISILFANDLIFQTNIKGNPIKFAWLSVVGIILAVVLKIFSEKYSEN